MKGIMDMSRRKFGYKIYLKKRARGKYVEQLFGKRRYRDLVNINYNNNCSNNNSVQLQNGNITFY